MERYAGFVVRRRKAITLLFILLALAGAVMTLGVKVNYNMVDYLPAGAQSTHAVSLMEREFTQAVPNASVMVRDVSPVQAVQYKEKLAGLPGVDEVLWLDDVIDIHRPLEMADAGTVEGFYKNGNALFSVSIREGAEVAATDAIRALAGPGGAVSGQAADNAVMQSATNAEVINAVLILLPAVLLILILSTGAWIEPLLFLGAIGVSILINMGSNLFISQISFVTNAVSPILQLAVSLDYAIFLLHSFSAYRGEGRPAEAAMVLAIQKSVKAVAASAVTTLFGFVALVFMDFGIGADLGLNLAKGIVLSFISCMVFLPALTLCALKLLDKTRHRKLMPAFRGVNRVFSKIAIPALALACLISLPAFLGQGRVGFAYGAAAAAGTGRSAQDKAAVEEAFGKTNVMALLVPRGDVVKEYELGQELERLPHVTQVLSYASSVGAGIPAEFLGEDVTGQFYSPNYARIIVYTDTADEGDEAFALVREIDEVVARYYGEGHYSAGQSANLYDMKNVVEKDNRLVNLIAVLSIFGVLLVTFKSATLPFILLFTIEVGIWINLAIPYFTGSTINFLGYLVINTVQLGATVDYAILLTTYYLDNRRLMSRKQAMNQALGEAFKSILISAATLATAGFILGLTSSNPAVSSLGLLLGRGTILSFVMVVCVLPALLRVLDKPIALTTYKAQFFRAQKQRGEDKAE